MKTPRVVIDDDGDKAITFQRHRATKENPVLSFKVFPLYVAAGLGALAAVAALCNILA